MTNVQTAIPFMTAGPSVAGFSPPGGPDAEQAFLAALALVPQRASRSPAPSAAESPAEGSPKIGPKPDIPLAEGDENVAKTLLTESELLLPAMVSEPTLPTETGTIPMGFFLPSTLALQAPLPSPVTTPGAEISNIWQTKPPDAAPKTPQRQSSSGPASATPEPDPLPATAAVLSVLSALEVDVAIGSGAYATAPVRSDPAPGPVAHDTDQKRNDLVGHQSPGNFSNIVFFQYVDTLDQSAAPGGPETGPLPKTGPSPDTPVVASNISPLSLPGSAAPVLQDDLAKPAPLATLECHSDRHPAGVRIALGSDVLSSRASPQTTKPVPTGPDISQEESVLRAIWVGSAKNDKTEKPMPGLIPASKDALQGGADAVAPPMKHGTPEAESPSPSQTLPADPSLAETVLAKPQPSSDGLPQADAPPVSSASHRANSAQPVDPAFLSVSALTERSTTSPKSDVPAPSPPHMQIAQVVSGTNQQTTEILLSPEELGHVRIDMRSDGERMVMTVSAERQDTLDLLRRHADQLAAELRAAGQSGVTLSFGRWSGSGFGAAPDGQPQGTPSAPHADPENLPPPLATLRPAIPASGLYLRI